MWEVAGGVLIAFAVIGIVRFLWRLILSTVDRIRDFFEVESLRANFHYHASHGDSDAIYRQIRDHLAADPIGYAWQRARMNRCVTKREYETQSLMTWQEVMQAREFRRLLKSVDRTKVL